MYVVAIFKKAPSSTSVSKTPVLTLGFFFFVHRVQAGNWLILRYPLASMMIIYIVFLVLIGYSKTRHFQNLYSKYFKES